MCCIISIIFFLQTVSAYYYYREDFSGALGAEWVSYFAYGRNGVIVPQIGTFPTTINVTGDMLQFRRLASDGDHDRNGYWSGRNVYNTNRFDASATRPFGVEIIRTYAWLDYASNSIDVTDSRRRCSVSIWLFRDTEPQMVKTLDYSRANEWIFMENQLEFANEVGVWGSERRRKIMYHEGIEVDLSTTNAVRPDGRLYDTSARVNFDFRLDQNTSEKQNDEVGFRFVHNGSTVFFQVNPDPYDNDAEPNEWMTIGSKEMTWNTGMQFMVGHAQKASRNNSLPTGSHFLQDADWDNFLIRSAAGTSKLYIPNTFVRPGIFQKAAFIISNTFSSTDSGINYIHIIKPDTFLWPSAIADICVRTGYEGNGELKTLKSVPYDHDRYPASDEAAIMIKKFYNPASGVIGKNDVRIILGSQISPLSKITRSDIEIEIMLKPLSDSFENDSFSVFITAEQFENTPRHQKNRYATCGWQKSGCAVIQAGEIKNNALAENALKN